MTLGGRLSQEKKDPAVKAVSHKETLKNYDFSQVNEK